MAFSFKFDEDESWCLMQHRISLNSFLKLSLSHPYSKGFEHAVEQFLLNRQYATQWLSRKRQKKPAHASVANNLIEKNPYPNSSPPYDRPHIWCKYFASFSCRLGRHKGWRNLTAARKSQKSGRCLSISNLCASFAGLVDSECAHRSREYFEQLQNAFSVGSKSSCKPT